MPKEPKFPDTIFVAHFEDDGHFDLNAYKDVESLLELEEKKIAVYKLVEVKVGKLIPHIK